MKQNEFKKCICCGKGMAAGGIHFYRVKVEQMLLNPAAIQRQAGLEMMMGGSAALAQVLGPNEDLAKGTGEHSFLVCGNCGILHSMHVAQMLESAADQEEKDQPNVG